MYIDLVIYAYLIRLIQICTEFLYNILVNDAYISKGTSDVRSINRFSFLFSFSRGLT